MARRITDRWKSKFARFIRSYGAERLAKQLDVGPSAVYHWIRGATTPRPVHAAIIQRLARESGVKLTLDHIYQHSRDVRARKRESGAALLQVPEVGIRANSFAQASAK